MCTCRDSKFFKTPFIPSRPDPYCTASPSVTLMNVQALTNDDDDLDIAHILDKVRGMRIDMQNFAQHAEHRARHADDKLGKIRADIQRVQGAMRANRNTVQAQAQRQQQREGGREGVSEGVTIATTPGVRVNVDPASNPIRSIHQLLNYSDVEVGDQMDDECTNSPRTGMKRRALSPVGQRAPTLARLQTTSSGVVKEKFNQVEVENSPDKHTNN